MERRRFGRTGALVPVVGMGTWRTFDVRGAEVERQRRVIFDEAMQAGANFVDSSPMYGEAERVLGEAIRPVREQVIVATKVWTPSPEEGRRQIERSLRHFGGRVDFFQVHNLVNWPAQLAELERRRDSGTVRWVGATHYSHSAFDDLRRVMETGRIDGIQIPYNAADRAVERDILPLAAELDVGVVVMRPLGAGDLVRATPAGDELRPLERYGIRTWAQALIKWILGDPRVHVAIPATSKPGRMAENAAAGEPPWLDEEDRERVAYLATRGTRHEG